ncbi:hypothetical protein VE03_08883 [Pseudogymnoascus sp. 23342-1-I1]|nr:hypothetical protein VE03_08883 [Pseudogymnoascus sp. 23342-1-I1]
MLPLVLLQHHGHRAPNAAQDPVCSSPSPSHPVRQGRQPTNRPPALHSKDLKTAMQDKDKNKLNVLRALLSQSLNASKTSSPIVTDMQMLALVRKNAAASKQAAAEFVEAGRQDLADKEAEQMRVMEEYIGEVKTVGEEEIRRVVGEVVEGLKAEGGKLQMGEVLKKVFSKEVLGERNVERATVARIVKEALAA